MSNYPMKKIARGQFNESQLIAIELLSLPNRGGLSLEEVAERANVSVRNLYEWRQQEKFQSQIQKRVILRVNEQVADVLDATVKRAIEGSGKHAELVLKTLGLLKDQHELIPKNPVSDEYDPRSNEAIEEEIELLKRQLGEIGEYGEDNK